jgi:lipoprotein signal peptidase
MTQPITLYSSKYCGHSQRVEQFLLEQKVAVDIISIDDNPDAREAVKSINNGYASVPTLIFPDGSTLTEPSIPELKRKLSENEPQVESKPRGFWQWIDLLFPYALIVFIFLTDRLSKQWALQFLAENGPTVINPFLTIRETYNRGIAFGWFQGIGPIVGWLTVGVVIFMFVMLVKTPRSDRLMRWGLALIIGGALGNQFDRLALQEVLDFIQIPIWSGTLNVADIAINTGMVLLILSMILSYFRPQQKIINEETSLL